MHQDPGVHSAVTIFAGLNLLDIASTRAALESGLAEANRIPSMLLASGGEPAMYLFKAAVSLLVIAATLRLSPHYRRLRYGLHVGNLLLAIIVILNLTQLFLL